MTSAETFSVDERRLLAPYFTNLDAPVFALRNLPEVVKGALFARYSRSAKSLRRLFLDEFMGEGLEAGGPDRARGPARPRRPKKPLRPRHRATATAPPPAGPTARARGPLHRAQMT